MIIEESEENEINLESKNFKLIVDDDESKRKKTLIKFFKVLRKNERSIVQFESQIFVKFFETDLIILMTITMTTFLKSSDAVSSKR